MPDYDFLQGRTPRPRHLPRRLTEKRRNALGLEIGKRYTAEIEVEATPQGVRFVGTGQTLASHYGAARKASFVEKVVPAPTWKPGDVVVVRYPGNPTAYTYVRGVNGWPGEFARPKTDQEISDLYRQGQATPVLQAGGVAFDEGRLP